MGVVNTNVSASIAQSALMRNERALNTAMEQLSTGKKINSAADNASGLAISTRMTAQIRGLDQAVRNANDAISMISTAEGALDEITSMLQRMRELAVQAGTGTTSTEDRDYLNDEYTHLLAEIERVSANTQWNGRDILDGNAAGSGQGTSVAFQVGMNPSQTISVGFGDFTSAGNGVMTSLNGFTLNSGSSSIASAITAASNVITAADVALEAVSTQRATFGAVSNRLTHAIDNLTNVKTEAEAARSRILDTDYAQSTSELARTQIIQQAGTAMLAQANQLPSTVLALLS
jgi:flagellin